MTPHSPEVFPVPAVDVQTLVAERLKNIAAVRAQQTTQAPDDKALIRTVAHDLRNPLGGISCLVDVLMEDDDLNTEQRDLLCLVKGTASYSLSLVNNLLEKKTPDKLKEPTDVQEVIMNCIIILYHKVAAKQQQIITDLAPGADKLMASREDIIRLVDNLLSNAIKFTPEGGLIKISAKTTDNNLCITVEDNGMGIPEHFQEKLFDNNAWFGRKGTAGEESFGLGLLICKQIVEEHGGRIWFESAVGIGTTFNVSLPLKAEQLSVLVA